MQQRWRIYISESLTALDRRRGNISSYATINTHRRRPRTTRTEQTPVPKDDRLQKLKTREGLHIKKDQVQRLWNLFDVNCTKDGGVEVPEEFHVEDFMTKYPFILKKPLATSTGNVNTDLAYSSSLIGSISTPSDYNIMQDHRIKDRLSSLDLNSGDGHHKDLFNPVVQEAELKLQRMLTKIYAHENRLQLPLDVQKKIRELITEELETVLELWLRISNTNDCQTLQHAMAATDRASDLLLYFQSLNEQGGMIINPPLRCYQRILQNYAHLFTVNERTLCIEDLLKFQCGGRRIIQGMMKVALTLRMQALNQDQEGERNMIIISWDSDSSLNDCYNTVLAMHTSEQMINQPLAPSMSQKELHAIITDVANNSCKLLQEMELYYHDFRTLPLPKEHIIFQKFLAGIYPTNYSFTSVIEGLLRSAKTFNCIYSLHRAVDTLERMQKRYIAYNKNGEMNNSSNSNSSDDSIAIDQNEVVKPGVELFARVLTQCKDMKSELNWNRMEQLIKSTQFVEHDERHLKQIMANLQRV